MTGKDEFQARMAERLRELRLALGYKTAASFARAIGYPPAKIRRYERVGIACSGALEKFTKAVDNAGFGKISIVWLLNCPPMWYRLPDKQPVRTEGNIVHVNFAG